MSSAHSQSSPKTLIIGWDAADWQLLRRFAQDGQMPGFQKLWQRSTYGHLATLQPVLSPLLWTSIATGRRAHEHGILAFAEWQSDAQQVVPVQAQHRRCKAFWNILEEAGLRTQVINWWPSYPVEQLSGAMVSNQFCDWPRADAPSSTGSGHVSPSHLQAELEPLRVHPGQLSAAQLQPFFPEHSQRQLREDPLVATVASILARATSLLQITQKLLARPHWDCTAVYFEALDHFSHAAMRYHPPQLADISDRDFARYQHIISAAYRWHDLLLQALLQSAGPACNIILLSDHGFESGSLRSAQLPDLPAAPALEHRPYGVFLAAGPQFGRGQKIFGASLLDVLPSLLHLYHLPVGEDLPGRVLGEAFRQKRPLSHLPTWEASPRAAPFVEASATTSPQVLAQLEALGYLQLPHNAQSEYLAREADYNCAISLMEGGRYAEALRLAEAQNPAAADLRWATLLADLYLRLQRYSDFDKLTAAWPPEVRRHPYALFLRGLAHLEKGQTAQALQHFAQLEEQGLRTPQLLSESGRALLVAGKAAEAERYFGQTLEIMPEHSGALTGLAAALLEQNRPEEALPLLEQSLQLRYWQPQAHYLLAVAWRQNGQVEAARTALAVCLRQAPRHAKAMALQAQMEGKTASAIGQETVVVSGFPRSGTSMIMALLQAGGLPLLTDAHRPADAHNPQGYFELAAVKQLPSTAALPPSAGCAVKVVLPLLRYLPPRRHYAVILLERPLLEVLLSQEKMKGKPAEAQNFPFQLAVQMEAEAERVEAWAQSQPHLRVQKFHYHHFLQAPEQSIRALQTFLGISLDESAALAAIKPHLYRSKIG